MEEKRQNHPTAVKNNRRTETAADHQHHSRQHQNEYSCGSSALPSSGSVCELCAELQVDQTNSTKPIKVSAPSWNIFGSDQNDGERFFYLNNVFRFFFNNYFS